MTTYRINTTDRKLVGWHRVEVAEWLQGDQERERRVRQRIRASLKEIVHDLNAVCGCQTCVTVRRIAAAYK